MNNVQFMSELTGKSHLNLRNITFKKFIDKITYDIHRAQHAYAYPSKYKTGTRESQILTFSSICESKIFEFPRIDIKLERQKKISKKLGNYVNARSFEKSGRKSDGEINM